MLDRDPTIGHRQDRTLEEYNNLLVDALVNGTEADVQAIQRNMRRDFGNLLD